ncbi:hypothetical protein AVEN_135644-1 [Araneus ventricosus]|uniref:Uncharacterized protein n=1 Tax=Araneus ventricosus TaxID=182803 RepID=A0A4Y2EI62_ARAVE|nr:hypothetical protein AVEN_135644-1 [Araneus ventricosus]
MGAEGPHADLKTERIAISLEGFGSWTIMQDPTQQGTHSSPGMGEIGSPGLQPRFVISDFSLLSFIEISTIGISLPKQAVKKIVRSLGTDFYQDGFLKLISRYDICINVSGEYVDK